VDAEVHGEDLGFNPKPEVADGNFKGVEGE